MASDMAGVTAGEDGGAARDLAALHGGGMDLAGGGHAAIHGRPRDSEVYRGISRSAYRIEKRPALARRQGAWAVIGQGGMILRRGHDLEQVLRFFDRGRFKVVD